MVRAAVQNITLNILKIQNPKLDVYLTNFPFINYFVNLAQYLKDIWTNIDEILPDCYFKDCTKLAELLDNQYDLLIYIDDIFKLDRNRISQILSNTLLSYLIIPNLIAPLTSSTKGAISLSLIQYLLNLIFSCLTYPPLLETIYVYLFSPKVNEELITLSHESPKAPSSYQKEWNFVTFWDQYEELMLKQYVELLRKAGNDVSEKTMNNNPFESRAFHQSKQGGQGLLSFLNVGKIFWNNPEAESVEGGLEEEHRSLTAATGVVTNFNILGLQDLVREAPLEVMRRFMDNFLEKGDARNMGVLKENPVRSIFLLFLMSKDDNMAALMCSILNSTLNNVYIPNKAIWISGLMCEYTYYKKADYVSEGKGGVSIKTEIKNKNFTVKYLLDLLYRLLIVDPPFRLATMGIVVKNIIELSWTHDEKVSISIENLNVFNQGYANAISKTMKLLQTNTTAEYYVEVHNIQWEKIYKRDLEEISRRNSIYTLLPVIEEPAPGIDLSMRMPSNEYETLQEVITIFFLFRKIRYLSNEFK